MRLRTLSLALLATLVSFVQAQAFTLLYEENFNSVTLGSSVNERLGFGIGTEVVGTPDYAPVQNVYSATGPAGWVVDNDFDNFGNVDLDNPNAPVGTIIGNVGVLNQGATDDGVDEWEGWSFVNKDFWVEAAGDQDRSEYLGGTGTVAVADPDEYDDLGEGRGGGYYNTGLSTPFIDVSPYVGPFSFLDLSFNSSWRPEAFDDEHEANATLNAAAGGPGAAAELNNSTAVIRTQFFDGAMNPLGSVDTPTIFDSDAGDPANGIPASPSYKPDMTDELITSSIPMPTDANVQYMQVTFGLINAGNDWWWAIDNLSLEQQGSGTPFWTEGFESVPLGPSINEQRSTVASHVTRIQDAENTSPREESFTKTPPAGWTVDDSEIPTPPLGNNDDGVYEFEGWSFMDLEFWNFADMQGREEFTKSDGAFAVADGDEWDDLNDPDGTALMKTVLQSPEIPVSPGPGAELLTLKFDSSWRDEDANLAVITVDFGDGSGPQEILRWDSDSGDEENGVPASPFYKPDATNESVLVNVEIPDGATTAQLAFRYEGGDDWWWAIDNIQVGTSAVPEPTSLVLCGLALTGFGLVRRR